MKLLVSFATGVLFGLGLILSGMANPAKILSFLNLAGQWDPTLLTVFAGALAVSVPGTQMVLRTGKPVLAKDLSLPGNRAIDRPLIAGAVIFGLGWGLAGFCPGPAITALASGKAMVVLFVAAMIAGMLAFAAFARWRASATDG
jgi:uncharacterized membrane protein YedE/YeeE